MRKLCSLLALGAAVGLLLCGCARAPKTPEAYVMGENSVAPLDNFMGTAEGVLVKIEEPSEELPDQYIYHYDQVLDPPGLANTYYDFLMAPEQGFTLTDENFVPTDEVSFEGMTGELIMVRPAVEENQLFRLVLGWTVDQVCTVNVTCVAGAIQEPVEEEEPEPATLVDQIEHMYTYTPKQLGLEGSSLREYKIFPVEGIMSVDGRACRQFNVYQVRQPENVSVIAGTYLLTLDLEDVYHLDLNTSTVTHLE